MQIDGDQLVLGLVSVPNKRAIPTFKKKHSTREAPLFAVPLHYHGKLVTVLFVDAMSVLDTQCGSILMIVVGIAGHHLFPQDLKSQALYHHVDP